MVLEVGPAGYRIRVSKTAAPSNGSKQLRWSTKPSVRMPRRRRPDSGSLADKLRGALGNRRRYRGFGFPITSSGTDT